MNDDVLKEACVDLMETADGAYLSTIGEDGYPHTRVVFNLRNRQQFPGQVPLFARHRDDLMIYVSTNTSSSKIREIKANPRVSVYYCDPKQFHGVMLAGDIEIVDDSEVKKVLWNEGWERYYPAGVGDPDYTVLRLFPKRAAGWVESSRFEFTLGDA